MVALLKITDIPNDTASSKQRRSAASMNAIIRQLAVHRIHFDVPATELGAPTVIDLVSPVVGAVSKLTTIIQTAIVTGGAITANVGTTPIDGLSITIANSATKGTVQSDTPTAGHASTIVAVGSRISIVPDAAFNGGGAVSGFIEITETPTDPNV